MIVWLCAVGLASATDGEVIELPPVEPLPSVVEVFEAEEQTLVRGRFGLRPELALTMLAAPSPRFGARLGGTLLHHWWTVPPEGRVRWTGETGVAASGLVGGVRGWEVSGWTEVGPWLGPVRIGLGPQLLSDRLNVPTLDEQMTASLLIGPRATLTVDAGPMQIWGGVAPAWAVAGARQDWAPGLTELGVHGGIAGRFRVARVLMVQLGLRTRVRLVEVGTVVDLGLRLHLTLGGLR
jgi:hypothetical protein